MVNVTSKQSKAITKAASKIIAKKSDKPLKLKKLCKKLLSKLSDELLTTEDLTDFIQSSELFDICKDGYVTEQNVVSSSGSASSGSGDDKKSSKKRKNDIVEKNNKKCKGDDANDGDISSWRNKNKIVVEAKDKGAEYLLPIRSFSEEAARKAALNPSLLKYCTDTKKFTQPSPIQAQCWPILAQGKHVVGIAETGSGKTLAFAMPALSNLTTKKKIQMLVLAPTRELAMQSHSVLDEFGALIGLQSMVVYGGVSKADQIRKLKKDCPQCVVATPGRLVDLLNDNSCDLSYVHYLVLDEADRMLDMGFEEDVRRIIGKCKPKDKRQTAMFSATWPASIQKLASEFLVDPIRVYVGFEAIVDENGDQNGINDSLSANKRVSQTVEVIDDRAREQRLKDLLQKYHRSRKNLVLVFALYKKEAQRLEDNLKRSGWNCCSIHGDKNQQSRTDALADFKSGKCPLLIATDVAARGLDIPNVEVVINYTFPLTIEDYVHRIGRTGRAGKTGISHTFFQPGDKSHAGELQQVMRQAGQSIPDELMAFGSTIKKKEHKLYGNFGPKDASMPMKKATKIVFDSDSE